MKKIQIKGNKMKVLAINGSARKDGNTADLIKAVFNVLKKENIDCEMIQLSGNTIRGCAACDQCYVNKDGKCVQKNDIVNEVIGKMKNADGIILASPTYFSNVSAEMKALIDRSGRVGRANNTMFKNKVGAAIVSVRRAGAIHAFNAINHFFFIEEMIVPGSCYWNIGIGKDKGDVKEDKEGMKTMKTLGEQMAWLLKKLNTS